MKEETKHSGLLPTALTVPVHSSTAAVTNSFSRSYPLGPLSLQSAVARRSRLSNRFVTAARKPVTASDKSISKCLSQSS